MSTPFPTPERQGPLDRVFLPGLLCQLHRLSFNGTVQVRRGPFTKSVYFRDGGILSAASNEDSDRLSSLLLRAGTVSPEQLEMAREKAGAGTSLGRSLVDLGFVSRNQLMETARDQVRGILESLFQWRDGEYRIEENELPATVPNLGMKTEKLLFDTLGGSTHREAILAEIGGMDRRFGAADAGRQDWRNWTLGGEAERVLGAVNGVRNVNHIAAEAGLDDFSAAKILCAGLHLGILERLGAPEPVRGAPASGPEEPHPEAEDMVVEPTSYSEAGMTGREPAAPEAPAPLPEAAPDRFEAGPAAVPAGMEDAGPVMRETKEGEEIPAIDRSVLPSRPEPIATMEMPPAETAEAEADPSGPPEDPRSSMNPTPIDPEPGQEPEEGPFEGFVDTGRPSPLRRGGGSGGGSRARWFAIGGILVALALLAYAGSLWLSRPASGPEPAVADDLAAPPAAGDGGEVGRRPGPEEPAVGKPAAPAPSAPRNGATVEPAALEEPVPAAPEPPPPAPVPAAAPSLDEARRALAAGDFARAAETFRSHLSESPDGYTLQVLLACQASTVAGMMPPPDDFLLLPQRYRGRDCFRVCWGRFADRKAALAARSRLPERFARLNGKPFPLALAGAVAAAESGSPK